MCTPTHTQVPDTHIYKLTQQRQIHWEGHVTHKTGVPIVVYYINSTSGQSTLGHNDPHRSPKPQRPRKKYFLKILAPPGFEPGREIDMCNAALFSSGPERWSHKREVVSSNPTEVLYFPVYHTYSSHPLHKRQTLYVMVFHEMRLPRTYNVLLVRSLYNKETLNLRVH